LLPSAPTAGVAAVVACAWVAAVVGAAVGVLPLQAANRLMMAVKVNASRGFLDS